MHEFVECCELEGYFVKIKGLINRCWGGGFVERMEWRELWLFGVTSRVESCNVNLLNYVLSHARFAVKHRRNVAHYEKKRVEVWSVFMSIMRRDVNMVYSYVWEDDFLRAGVLKGLTTEGQFRNPKFD